MTEIVLRLLGQVLQSQVLQQGDLGSDTQPIEETDLEPPLEPVSALPFPDSLEDLQPANVNSDDYWLSDYELDPLVAFRLNGVMALVILSGTSAHYYYMNKGEHDYYNYGLHLVLYGLNWSVWLLTAIVDSL